MKFNEGQHDSTFYSLQDQHDSIFYLLYWYNSTNSDFTGTKVQILAGKGISARHCSMCIVENESKDSKCQVCGASIPKVLASFVFTSKVSICTFVPVKYAAQAYLKVGNQYRNLPLTFSSVDMHSHLIFFPP